MSNIVSQAELSRITNCSRANISKLTKQNPPVLIAEKDGKIDIDNETNRVWYETRMIKIGKDPYEKQNNNGKDPYEKPAGTEKKPEEKTNAVTANEKKEKKPREKKKKKSEINIEAESTIELETDQIPENEEKQTESTDTNKPQEPLAAQKLRLEVGNLREKLEKAKIENKKARAALVEIDTLGMALFGYLIALNKNILSMPQSYVDEFAAGQKAGKSKTELTDILIKPISSAIIDSRDQMKKEMEKYKRATRQTNGTNENEE